MQTLLISIFWRFKWFRHFKKIINAWYLQSELFFFCFCISKFNVLPAVSVLLFHTLKWPRKGQIIVPLNHYFLWNKKLARHLISSYEGFSMCRSDVNYFFPAKVVLFHLITCGKNLFGLSVLICEHFASHIQIPKHAILQVLSQPRFHANQQVDDTSTLNYAN